MDAGSIKGLFTHPATVRVQEARQHLRGPSAEARIQVPSQVVAAAPTLYRADSVEQGLSAQSVTLSSSLGEILSSASQEALRIEGRSADGVLSSHGNDRRESNGYATTSNGATVSDPVELFLSELKACDQIEDIMEMAIEESALMDGGSIAAALLRCVAIVKTQRSERKEKTIGIENGQALAVLLQLLQREATNMLAADLVMCLWSLASMRTKVVRVIKVLQKQISAKLPELSEREMALTLWSYATLDHHPGSFMDSAAQEACQRLSKFKPQGLSMMMWAYGKLESPPSLEFTGGVISLMESRLPTYSPQSIANILHATGKLSYPLKARFCELIEARIAEAPQGFKDIELANILYGFAKSRYRSQRLVDVLENRIMKKQVNMSTLASVYGTLCWACGLLSMELKPATSSTIETFNLHKLRDLSAQSACHIAWGLARQGQAQQPIFNAALEKMPEFYEKRQLDPRMLRQLFQAITSGRTQGVDVTIPADLEQTAHSWWRRSAVSNTMSLTHAAVAKAFKSLGVRFRSQQSPGDGLPTIDIAVSRSENQDFAILIVNPMEFSINGGDPLGRMTSSRKLLEQAGWDVAFINSSDVGDLGNEPRLLSFLGPLLEKHGISTPWEARAASADKPAPLGIRSNRSRNSVEVPEPVTAEQRRSSISSDIELDSESDEEQSDVAERVSELRQNEATAQFAAALSAEESAGQSLKASGRKKLYEVPKRMQIKKLPTSPASAASGVRLESGSELRDRLDQKALKEDSPEAQRERELRAAEKKKYVAKQLSGDFMDGWENLANWKAMKTVKPVRRT